MKNILKVMIPCLAAVFALASCNDTMDDKAVIDAQYAKTATATVSLTSATAIDFQSVNAKGALTATDEVIENGIQLSKDANFASDIITVSDTIVSASFAGMSDASSAYVLRGTGFRM